MFKRIVAGMKLALGLYHPGRNLAVLPDDVFLVSYPKSGNTWTRFLIANLLYPEKHPDFSNINLVIPDPEALSKRTLAKLPRPRILKSHQYFDPRYRRVIYVVRDPRDVLVSQYHFHIKRRVIHDSFPVDDFAKRFVAGETSPYASWGENVAGWLATRYNTPGFLLLRYEDMIADTREALTKVAAFLEIPRDAESVAWAVEQSSAERMRELEKKQALKWSSTKDTRQDIPFVRTARPGNWRSTLSERALAIVENNWASLMQWLRYELVSDPKPESMTVTLDTIVR
jgi:hypothetical protein